MAAAAALPAPLPQQAVAVTINQAMIDRPLVLPASEGLVAATPFLPWTNAPAVVAGAPAEVMLSQFRAIRAFLCAAVR